MGQTARGENLIQMLIIHGERNKAQSIVALTLMICTHAYHPGTTLTTEDALTARESNLPKSISPKRITLRAIDLKKDTGITVARLMI